MIKFSDTAKKHFEKLLSKQKKDTHIRISIKFPGTPLADCNISYCDLDDVDSLIDKKFCYKTFNVYINKSFILYLKNSEIDLVQNDIESKIIFKVPYAKSIYNPKKNESLEIRINYFILTEINPYLMSHGGEVVLVKISKLGCLYLQFRGGCNGCSMVNITLKDSIEKKIITKFNEIKSIKDITNHIHTNNSYC